MTLKSQFTTQRPNRFFNQLKALKVQYEDDINDEMLINEVMVKAPQKYQSIIATECRTKGKNLKLEHLKDCMNELYRMSANSYNGSRYDDSDDKSLKGEVVGSAFAGEYYNCGSKGDRASQCPEKNKGGSYNRNRKGFNNKSGAKSNGKKAKFNRTCNNCGMWSHMKKDCFELETNAHRRPRGWKSNKSNKTAGTA